MTLSDLFKLREVLPTVTLDRSDLEATAACPFMAAALRDGKVRDASHLQQVGIECHRIIAEAIESVGDDYRGITEWLEAEMDKARPDLQPDVIAALKGSLGEFSRLSAERVIGVEKQYSTQFLEITAQRGAVILTCCIDLVMAGKDDQTLIVFDWKTGWKRRSSSEAQNAFQTCFYAWVLFRELPQLQTIHMFYEQTRYGNKAYAKLERERDFFHFEGRVQSSVQLRLSGCHYAWPTLEKCSYCPATAICPEVAADIRNFAADPEAYLQQYIALKEGRVEAMEKTMKAYCKSHGEIRSGDNVFGYRKPAQKVMYKLYHDDKNDNVDDE